MRVEMRETLCPTAWMTMEAAQLRLGGQALGPFSLNIRHGERVAILGPSGAGKSTLLRLMARDLLPQQGDVCLFGRDARDWPSSALSRRRAVLPQSHEVAFGMKVELVIGLGRVACGVDPALRQIVRDAASLACADHLLTRRFDTLSGGERARVQLARVMAQLWDVEQGAVMVDEPLAALDPGLQVGLMQAIQDFAVQRGHAVVAVLHDLNQALADFDRLLLVRSGQLMADLPSSTQAVPALAELYGVRLTVAHDASGASFVMPARMQQTARWAERPSQVPRMEKHERMAV